MDRPADTSPAPAAAAVPVQVAAGEPSRAPDLLVGQRILATVAALDGERVWLGFRGALIEARTALELAVGRSYEFTIADIGPPLLLQVPKAAAQAATTALPGSDAVVWQQALAELSRALPHGALPHDLSRRFQDLAPAPGAAAPTAAQLAMLQRGLGHEQEAAVLRLQQLPPAAIAEQAAVLRATAKAFALSLLAATPPPAPRQQRAAQRLVQALSAIERDNAQRRDCGAPLWLPLPADPRAGLLDARMFLRLCEHEARSDASDREGNAFTIVLLLELSRLGPLRVDVTLQGERVRAVFTAVRPPTVAHLRQELSALRLGLQGAKLLVADLQVRMAPGDLLPVNDLRAPLHDGSRLIDCHA